MLTNEGIACDIYDFDSTTFSMDFMGPLRLVLAIKQNPDKYVRLYLAVDYSMHYNVLEHMIFQTHTFLFTIFTSEIFSIWTPTMKNAN